MPLSDLLRSLPYSNFKDRVSSADFIDQPLNSASFRRLSNSEIESLEKQGNICADWSRIRVSRDFIGAHIHHSIFLGDCAIGVLDGRLQALSDGSRLPSGIYYSCLDSVRVGNGACIHRCPTLSNYRLGKNVVVADSKLVGNEKNNFGNGLWINVGIEIGGRQVPIFADLSLEMAEFILSNPGNAHIHSEAERFLETYVAEIAKPFGIVDDEAQILSTRLVRGSYVGPFAVVSHAEVIENTTLLSTAEDPSLIGAASIVRDSIMQEGSSVEDAAIIQSSMLFEHSHATQQGQVFDSIVGPNSGVSRGEATSSFLGPFVGFHHQSLLIAAFWPRGRGNVAYGANVGSNHTTRMPDQEFWPGEGMFFGLGTTIKYPANFRDAPYTIVAAGVTTLPQRMSYPFSLINEPVGYYLEVPPGFQNLIPAWGLTENFYSLRRNEGKYIARNKAKRNCFDLNLFRDEILETMRSAVKRLKNITERKTIYLPGDVPEIGKNMLTDENRLRAIEAYGFFLDLAQYRAEATTLKESPKQPRTDKEKNRALEHLGLLESMLPSLVERTERSRSRDFERGSGIIDDYAKTHLPVDKDPFVLQVREEVAAEIAGLAALKRVLDGS